MTDDRFTTDPEARRLVETLRLIEGADLDTEARRAISRAVRTLHNHRLRANVELKQMMGQIGVITNVLTLASQVDPQAPEAAARAQEEMARRFGTAFAELSETRASLRLLYDELDTYRLT